MNEVVQRYLTGTGNGPGPEIFVAFGFAHCDNPRRYVRQLVEDWSPRMETHLFEGGDGIEAGVGLAYLSGDEDSILTPKDGGIHIGLRTRDRASSEHWRREIELCLDRLAFRFRKDPLTYEWTDHA